MSRTLRFKFALAAVALAISANAQTLQVYGAWHCGNDYCTNPQYSRMEKIPPSRGFRVSNRLLNIAQFIFGVILASNVRQRPPRSRRRFPSDSRRPVARARVPD